MAILYNWECTVLNLNVSALTYYSSTCLKSQYVTVQPYLGYQYLSNRIIQFAHRHTGQFSLLTEPFLLEKNLCYARKLLDFS